jgi:SNF2 family DNA or RNA helicase
MGGKPIKLWGGFHFLEPQAFTSKWRWAGEWLDVTKETIYVQGKKREIVTVGNIQEGREEQFQSAHAQFAVRRLRKEVLPELPEKQWRDVWCRMTKKQEKQYQQFAADTEIRIDEHYLTATSILAEYTRLKQFANSYCEVEQIGVDDEGMPELKVMATTECGKLPYLMDNLAAVGIDPDEPDGEAQAIVTSQFKETADMVYDYLTERGIPCAKITGDVNKRGERAEIVRAFKHAGDHKGLRVVVMTTTAGGVAITLDNVESVHILDETWNPDDQEQVADRAVNTSTLHQVTAFVYRSYGTIEVDIAETTDEKGIINQNVLDLVRQRQKARLQEAA